MKRVYWFICLLIYSFASDAQTLQERLAIAVDRLQIDVQMKHATLGLSIVKTETGEKVYEVNAQTGLAPASCQKIITSATAMELLGPQYRYQTVLEYDGTISQGILKGNLYVIGSGDPSLGSWRFDSTKEERVLNEWIEALKQKGIQKIEGALTGLNGKWEQDILPGGWIWDDIGNYYGAGTSALNWHENQYDLILRSSDTIGAHVTIVDMKPKPYRIQLESEALAAAKGTGDNAYIYLPPLAQHGFVRGTIPVGEKAFTISGSFPDPSLQLISTLYNKLDSANIKPQRYYLNSAKEPPVYTTLQIHSSPSLDSLNYWFMKKSINLYGEALVKTIAYEKNRFGFNR